MELVFVSPKKPDYSIGQDRQQNKRTLEHAADLVANKKYSEAKNIYATLLQQAIFHDENGNTARSHRILDQLLDTALDYVLNSKINNAYDIYSVLEDAPYGLKEYYKEEIAHLQFSKNTKTDKKLIGILEYACKKSSSERKVAFAFLASSKDNRLDVRGQYPLSHRQYQIDTYIVNLSKDQVAKLTEEAKTDPMAQYTLGVYYMEGKLVQQSDTKTELYLKKSFEQGNIEAAFKLGESFMLRSTFRKDPEMAKKWYKTAAEAGHPEAAFQLAKLYQVEGGTSGKKNFLACSSVAHDLGHKEAALNVANWYAQKVKNISLHGSLVVLTEGDIINSKLAKEWYDKANAANENNFPKAKGWLNDFAQDKKKKFNLLKSDKNQSGVASDFSKTNNLEVPLPLIDLTKSADEGDLKSQYILGTSYLKQASIDHQIKGAFYIRKAALNGHEPSQKSFEILKANWKFGTVYYDGQPFNPTLVNAESKKEISLMGPKLEDTNLEGANLNEITLQSKTIIESNEITETNTKPIVKSTKSEETILTDLKKNFTSVISQFTQNQQPKSFDHHDDL